MWVGPKTWQAKRIVWGLGGWRGQTEGDQITISKLDVKYDTQRQKLKCHFTVSPQITAIL